MKIITQLLAGDLQYSKEEIEAEQALIDDQLDAVPTTPEAVEAADVVDAEDEVLESSEADIAETTEACVDMDEASQSLESLVEFLNMESADLTQREYSMIMATANGYLAKAKIDSDVLSFEESTALTTVPRETAKATLGEKAKQLGAGAIEALKKLLASIGQWLAGLFNKVKRTRNTLLSLGKALETSKLPHANITLPAKYAKAVEADVLPKLGKATHDILTERVKSIAQIAHSFQAPSPDQALSSIRFVTPELDGLPGEPHLDGLNLVEDIDQLWEKSTFTIKGSVVGDKEVSYPFNAQRAKSDVAGMIKLMDGVLAVEARWNQISADLKKAAGNAGANWGEGFVRKMGVSGAARLFDVGPRKFISYLATIVGLRAEAYAYALKHGTSESTVEAGQPAEA